MKKLFLILLLFLTFISSSFAYISYNSSIYDNSLNNLTFTDLVINATNALKANNYSDYIVFHPRSNLVIYFGSQSFIYNKFQINNSKDIETFGITQGSGNPYGNYVIGINIEGIENFSKTYTKNQTYIAVQNTIIHELTHYMYETQLIPEPETSKILKITYKNYPYISDNTSFYYSYTKYNAGNLTNLTADQQLSLDFQDVFNTSSLGYTQDEFAQEIIARVNAVCIQEDQNYTHYWEMMKKSPYPYCQEYNYPNYYIQDYDNMMTSIINAYSSEVLGIKDPNYNNIKSSNEISYVNTQAFYILGYTLNDVSLLLQGNYLGLMVVFLIISGTTLIIFAILKKIIEETKFK
jgi:hypothetical protein